MLTLLKYFLYVRKSTDAEDRQVRSIDAQLFELREIARRLGLQVVEEFVEKQSAKTPGRPVFNAMMTRIEAGEASGILAWHADRLARNSIDAGHVIYLFDTLKLKRLQFYGATVENTPQGKMLLNTEFGFSKYYVDSLSENVKRGHRDRFQRGVYPGCAPFGYLNNPRTKRIAIDTRRAPLVKRAFEMYSAGNETYDSIRKYFAANGVLTKSTKRSNGGKLVGRTRIADMLSNPVYYGDFEWTGELHSGIHEPIISKLLFDRAQNVTKRRWRWSPSKHEKIPKPFLGLLRCHDCGGAISAEIQKGHTYYRCTKKNKMALYCEQPYIREEALDIEISRLLSTFNIAPDWADTMYMRISSDQGQKSEFTSRAIREKHQEIERITDRLSKLKELLMEDLLDHDEARSDRTALMSKNRSLTEEIENLSQASTAWLEPFKLWVSEAQSLGEIARYGSLTAKKVFAKKVFGSNLILDQKKARGVAVKPWSFLADNELSHDTAQTYDLARTYFSSN